MEKEKKPVPHDVTLGRRLIGGEIDKVLKGFEGSGLTDNPALYNALVVYGKYIAGQQQILTELVARVEALEKSK